MTADLSPPLIRQARFLAHREGLKTAEIVHKLGTDYQKTLLAIKGSTYREIGGPLPSHNENARKCAHCGVLTYQMLCRWCRNEGRGAEDVKRSKETTMGYGHIFTRDICADLHQRYYQDEGRSVSWIALHNEFQRTSYCTLARYFKMYGLPFEPRHKTPRMKMPDDEEADEQPVMSEEPVTKSLVTQADVAGLPPSLADKVKQAWGQLQGLQEIGSIEVTAVTLSFDLRIER